MKGISQLVDMVYASAADPQKYDALMDVWARHIDAALTSVDPAIDGHVTDAAEIERHFNRAFTILERLGRQAAEAHDADMAPLGMAVEGETRPALLVEASGRIAAVNDLAFEQFGLSAGDHISGLSLEANGLGNIRQALSRIEIEPVGRLLTITRILSRHDGATPIIALNRVANDDSGRPMALLSVADMAWSARVGDMLRQTFGLSVAECEIARGIIGGLSVDQIAVKRGRSPQTVKTQSKAVLRKLDLRTQVELIRMVAALMQMDAATEMGRRDDGKCSRPAILFAKTRPLETVTIGPDDGRPVLFMHSMLEGYGVTQAMKQALERRGIRLICPVRPNFGASAPDGGAPRAPERFAADLEAVMDHYGVTQCPIMGHMAGSVYAFAAAARLGSRITRIVNISGGIPIVSAKQFAFMAPRQRIVAYTARVAPKLLPLIVRAGIASLDSGGEQAFMDALHRAAPQDYKVASTAENFALLREGYQFTVVQGHRAFEIDAYHVVRDWSEYVEGSTQPVLLLHGAHDPVVNIATVRDFAGRLNGRAILREFPDHGQLLFYDRPKYVLDALEEATEPQACYRSFEPAFLAGR
ncbi:alpha/beta fold hydrolase [Sphingopyxis granuli]|uniref:alpha/beta fold hydrolase n=1 Tax=Sphingopyxis granuli TaxID=267128 RepID=UPI001F538164|nr:alpha/beta fold hydrolase [Sphingopyxis granuli]UNK79196.1 alpha/beta fold hydrolase [Sphingopyxis granuli]